MNSATSDSPRLWGLIVRELWRRARRRLRAGPIYRWRFAGRTPERVLIAPPDLRLADSQIALEIYSGRFPLAGHIVETGGESPFRIEVSNRPWLEALHGFRWLRHMRASGTDLASANARALVGDWISGPGARIGGIGWEPEITAIRIISWLQHSTIVLQGSEFGFYRTFLKSLSAQIRYLRTMAPEMPDGEGRLRARIALAYAALSLPMAPASLRSATRNLSVELHHQILADGGHVSRNPNALLELLADLLPLRQTYANQAETLPPALIGAVERMLPMLRFFRHQDGNLARFNGVGPISADRIIGILQHDETQGAPLSHAPHSGYERLQQGHTTVIADTGVAPPVDVSGEAHAGCLSFEMSSGRHQFIINCGVDTFGAADFRPLARATAAHSTAVLNDTSSARLALGGWAHDMIGTRLVSGPKKVTCTREDGEGFQGFTAKHDGYVGRFDLWHERQLTLRESGLILDGRDRFCRPNGEPARDNGKDAVAIRFHVHPDVELYKDEYGQMTLAAPGGDVWVFTCGGPQPEIESSIYFAGIAGPVRTTQMVIVLKASAVPEIHWRLTKMASAGSV